MYPKIRKPLTTWLLTVITSGLYQLFWVWNVCNEINFAEEKTVLNIVRWRIIFLATLTLIVAGVIASNFGASPLLVLFPAAVYFGLILYVQGKLGQYVRKKDIKLQTGKEFNVILYFFLFWLVANTGAAYIQVALNRVIEHGRGRS